jgi:hypothetical protein
VCRVPSVTKSRSLMATTSKTPRILLTTRAECFSSDILGTRRILTYERSRRGTISLTSTPSDLLPESRVDEPGNLRPRPYHVGGNVTTITSFPVNSISAYEFEILPRWDPASTYRQFTWVYS